ncbi:PQQ-binding-like beta-propeller repeat protein [Streptomyces malaysiense]|uniref:outer membrane protein assembly factor BamB family protein n=1 Tax=Streptomyces malaysiense TaxID=1428626 RepID=UPI0009A100C9|nr:PQQ-binding-like beta-propeller repeat protein [Streptomyces malaysiense]
MTQPPPPPPNQPPQQGGFGPPTPPVPPHSLDKQPPAAPPPPQGTPGQQPPQPPQPTPPGPPQQPAPGYGYPQPTPPPPAGYGYPAAPPNPYGQQPSGPYGAPQQNPYAMPTQPMQQSGQPGYGYPGQPPTMPMQPQGGGGGRNNTALYIVIAAAVVIALIVAGGIWYAGSGDGGTKQDTASSGGTDGGGQDKGSGGSTGGKEKVPANTAAKVLFQVPSPSVKDTVSTSGSWLTDKVYAKTGVDEVVGYDPVKGTELWTVKLPGPVCAASRHITDDDKTAITYQPTNKKYEGCSDIAAIDLDAGKKLWTKTVNVGDYPVNYQNVTVSQRTVALGDTNGGAAFDIDSGKPLWQPKPGEDCYDSGYGGGAKLVAVRSCGDSDNTQLSIQTIDPRSGKVVSEYKMDPGIEYASIVSTDPLVVAADVGDSAGDGSGISDYFSIDDKTGKLLARISAPGKNYGGRCDGITRIEDCHEVVVGGGKLFVPTEEHDGSGTSYSTTNEVVAFDLTTGKPTGQRAEAGDGYLLSPLRMDGGNLIAYKKPPYDKGGQIVSIDGSTFKETKLLENPSTQSVRRAEGSMLPDYAEILFANGRLYMSDVFVDKADPNDDKSYLVLAFGTDG